jgi:hypothetical protein
MASWTEVKEIALDTLQQRPLDDVYAERLKFELKEIDKQGAGAKWENYYNDGVKFSSNPNFLLLPWILGMVDDDPIATRTEPMLNTVRASVLKEYNKQNGSLPFDIIKDSDMPDIDLDCLPEARDPIKEYAAEQYGMGIKDGYGAVCSVGTWQTYKFKNAVVDACAGTGLVERHEAHELTTELPEEVDGLKDGGRAICKGRINRNGEDAECGCSHDAAVCPNCGSTDTDAPTIGKLIAEYEKLAEFNDRYPEVIKYAVQLVGRIRNMGMHAGAIIIADRPLFGNIPMSRSSKGQWVSMWTEGRNTQLSKFGYNKWDILGLKTLKYIFECCKLIEKNRGISFGENMCGWDFNDPEQSVAGWYLDGNGNKQTIDLNCPHALQLANDLKVDGVFQFDTDLAKQILSNGVRNFNDLLLFNAMGHPGPMQCIRSDSNVNTEKGPVRIDELNGEPILYLSDDGIKTTKDYLVVESGEKELLEIELENGVKHYVSHDHEFLTKRGFIRAGDLTESDEVCAHIA